eukprot:175890_1
MGNENSNSIIQINVLTKGCVKDKLTIDSVYSKEQKMKEILNKITTDLSQKYTPMKYTIYRIDSDSFTGSVQGNENIVLLQKKSITDYDRSEVKKKGLIVSLVGHYTHKVDEVTIECPEMIHKKTNDVTQCSIYSAMVQDYQYNPQSLYHLEQYTHFVDEYHGKMLCRHKDQCKAYKRLEHGGNAIADQCHIKLYRHPPRQRNIKLAENVNAFIMNEDKKQNHEKYKPTEEDRKRYDFDWDGSDGYLQALIEEVIVNGFKSDLCLECGSDDDCKHIEYSILSVVDNKMNHYRHKLMGEPLDRGEMLALILYTGCDCNYDLCASQRNGDYMKWKWFDYCLCDAIWTLSDREHGLFSVFSGLNNVKLSSKSVKCGWFRTYVSTAWNRAVAETFMSGNGMILNIDKEFKNYEDVYCCDVSWISKFPDECEVLFARSIGLNWDEFECAVLDEVNGIQNVSLIKHA